MTRELGLNPLVAYVYEDDCLADDVMVKECQRKAEETLERVANIKFKAACQGLTITLGQTMAGHSFAGAEKHFKFEEFLEKPHLQRIKVSQLQKLELKKSEAN